jgi:hypothetical protein
MATQFFTQFGTGKEFSLADAQSTGGQFVESGTGQIRTFDQPTTTITSGDLGTTGTDVNLSTDVSGVTGLEAGEVAAAAAGVGKEDIQQRIGGVSDAEREVQTSEDLLRESIEALGGQGAYIDAEGNVVAPGAEAQFEQDLGVAAAESAITELSGQLDVLQAEREAIPLQIQNEFEGRGVTRRGTRIQEIGRLRSNAIDILATSSLLSARRGELADAQRKVERAMELKFAPMIAEVMTQRQLYDLNKDALERADAKKAAQLEFDISERERILRETIAEEQQKNAIMLDAAASNADNETLEKIRKVTNVEDAIALAAPFLADESKNHQIVKLDDGETVVVDMDTGTIINNLGGASVEGVNVSALQGEYGGMLRIAAGLVGAERGKTSLANMSQSLANGDFASTYAVMANNVEEALTGENATRFGAQRNDYVALEGLRNAIQEYADGGGNMNFLVGKEEEIKRKLGIDSGEASALAVQLWREFQTYRNVMTGAAFTPQESADYAAVNPTLGKSLDLNMNIIDGAMAGLENRIISTVEVRVPGSTELWESIDSDEDAWLEYQSKINQ